MTETGSPRGDQGDLESTRRRRASRAAHVPRLRARRRSRGVRRVGSSSDRGSRSAECGRRPPRRDVDSDEHLGDHHRATSAGLAGDGRRGSTSLGPRSVKPRAAWIARPGSSPAGRTSGRRSGPRDSGGHRARAAGRRREEGSSAAARARHGARRRPPSAGRARRAGRGRTDGRARTPRSGAYAGVRRGNGLR